MKKINFLTLLVTMVMAMVAAPAWADWGSESVTMSVGETKTLYLPSFITSKTLKSVTFYSASYQYVEVQSYTNNSVKVKALKAISTPVIVRCDYYYYVTNGGYTYQASGAYDFKVTVVGETVVRPDQVDVQNFLQVPVGGSKQVAVTVAPANAVYTLSYSISDTTVASVSSDGIVYGKKAGGTDLKVKADNGKYGMCRVTVYEVKPTSIDIPTSISLENGKSKTLTPTVLPADAIYTLTWTSKNTNVATVSRSGTITAKGVGATFIKVTTDNGKSDSCLVSVTSKAVTSVSVKSSLTLEVGDEYVLTPTVMPTDAQTSFSWSSSDNIVAAVSQAGVVKAKSAGNATITVKTSNGKSAACNVTVKTSQPSSSGDWSGTYSVTSSVERKHASDYNFPSHFTMIIKMVNGSYYVTEMLGLDLDHSIYDGIKVNVLDGQRAELDLNDNNDLGGFTTAGNYLGGLYLISANATYQWTDLGHLYLTRTSDGSIVMDDFNVFAFGSNTDYGYVLDAAYHNVKASDTSSVTDIADDGEQLGQLEIYNLNGVLIYDGSDDGKPRLAPGVYVLRRGSSVHKIMVR